MSTLTDEELNEEICKWLGWSYGMNYSGSGNEWHDPEGCAHGSSPGLDHIAGPEALGNMHSAEAKLTDFEHARFRNYLHDECKPSAELRPFEKSFLHERNYCSATDRQRATALLHVVKPELFQ